MTVPRETLCWSWEQADGSRLPMPPLEVVGERACAAAGDLLPQVGMAWREFVDQEGSLMMQFLDGGALVVTMRSEDGQVRQLLLLDGDADQLQVVHDDQVDGLRFLGLIFAVLGHPAGWPC
jgi:hypothetical protein